MYLEKLFCPRESRTPRRRGTLPWLCGLALAMPATLSKVVYPKIEPANIEPGRRYRMAMLLREAFLFGNTFKLDTTSFRVTELEAAEVLERLFRSGE
jgi:hypothetical protein